MREIKFRAWDTEDEVMLNGEAIAWVTLATLEEEHSNHYMQYTGLKDKNDVEIYEGDIVEYKTENTEGSPKKPKTVKWVARKYYAGWNIGRSHLGYEVIGNIYEAPDLLNSGQPTSEHETNTKASPS